MRSDFQRSPRTTASDTNAFPEQPAEFHNNDQVAQGHARRRNRPANNYRPLLKPSDVEKDRGWDKKPEESRNNRGFGSYVVDPKEGEINPHYE